MWAGGGGLWVGGGGLCGGGGGEGGLRAGGGGATSGTWLNQAEGTTAAGVPAVEVSRTMPARPALCAPDEQREMHPCTSEWREAATVRAAHCAGRIIIGNCELLSSSWCCREGASLTSIGVVQRQRSICLPPGRSG